MQKMDARVSRQIRRVLGLSAALHVRRGCVEAGAQHRQTPDGQSGVRQPADPEREVEPLGQQIDPTRRQVQIDPDLGVTLEVLRQDGCHESRADLSFHGNAKRALRSFGQTAHLLMSLARGGDDPLSKG